MFKLVSANGTQRYCSFSKILPRSVVVEKQNWGVSAGADGALVGWTMVFLGLGTGMSAGGAAAVWPVGAASPFCAVQRMFATLSAFDKSV